MITKLHVQNFKCLRDVSVDLRPFTVLIGKNDTGKSSLLEAIRTLGGLVQATPRPPAIPIDKLATAGVEPRAIGWDVEVAPTARNRLPAAAKYALRISSSPHTSSRCRIEEETLEMPDASAGYVAEGKQRITRLVDGPAHIDFSTDEGTTAVSHAGARRDFDRIAAFGRALAASEIYRFEPERLAEPAAYPLNTTDSRATPDISFDGTGLAVLLDHIIGTDRAAFESIERELASAVPYIKSIRLHFFHQAVPGAAARVGKSISFELKDGHEIEAALASQGVMLYLAYLSLVHSARSPAIMLIEEPENGIHPRQLQRVAEYLRRLTDPSRGKDAVQIVTATHSPYFLDFVPPEDVLVFGRKESGETIVRPLIALPGVKERLASGFSLGEMWFNVGEDRLLAEALA
jgi:predicted ATPase